MSSRSNTTSYRVKTSGDSVPEFVVKGTDLLDRAHQVCREMDRRVQELIGQRDSQPAASHPTDNV
jgi:hypothetical protein